MANPAAKPNFSLNLLIDKEKNRVVLAEAGKDFVDVLFSLLTLPMGTIVRFLEKHQKPQSSIVGCFHNLYKSVSNMEVDAFETVDCKNLLMHPRSLDEIDSYRRKLKLNIDDTEATKFFLCPGFRTYDKCRKVYRSWSTTRCTNCGSLTSREILVEANQDFLSDRTPFIITNDLKVAPNSTGLVLNVLNDLGYGGFDSFEEMLIDVGFQEVVTLLGCLFTSEAPLTDSFLGKRCMARKCKMSTPLVQEITIARDSDKLLTLKVYVRKTDHKILYAECREDFVDFLFSFLAIPLQFAWDISIGTENKGCIGNLSRSLNEMRFDQLGKSQVHKCILPYYYQIPAQLLDVDVEEVPEYELLVNLSNHKCGNLSKKIPDEERLVGHSVFKLKTVDLNVKVASGSAAKGFLKGKSNFIVSDDMVITPIKLCSMVPMLSKLETKISDIEEHEISIGKSEAMRLLRACLITTSALNNGLSNFIQKLKPTKDPSSTSKSIKTENTL